MIANVSETPDELHRLAGLIHPGQVQRLTPVMEELSILTGYEFQILAEDALYLALRGATFDQLLEHFLLRVEVAKKTGGAMV